MATTAAPPERGAYAERLLALVNAARQQAGVAPLQLHDDLNAAAREHSADMVARNYFSHFGPDGRTPWDRLAAEGVTTGGQENIAMGQATPEEAVESWMASEGHRQNLLDPAFRFMGIGVQTGADGAPRWTQTFA